MDQIYNEFADTWLTMTKKQRERIEEVELRYFIQDDFLKILRQKIEATSKKKYQYLVTFTIDPKKHPDWQSSATLEQTVDYIVESQQDRKLSLQMTFYAYSKEYTKKGMPHWHAVVVTTKPLPKNRFAYFESTYGSIDISKTKVTTHLEALDYISKDVAPTVLIDD